MVPSKEALETEIKDLESTLSSLQTQRNEAESRLKNSIDPATAVQRHIRLLRDYNAIRDVALSFVGKIAEKERCRAADILKEYNMNADD